MAAALLHRAIGEQLICVFVDNGLLRARRGRRGDGGLRRAPPCIRHRGRCRGALLRGATRDRGPRGEAQADRVRVHRGLRGGGLETARRALVGARHDLPRCHRIGRGQDRQGAGDQIPPQRGRPARAHASSAHRALARLFKDEVRKLGVELGLPYDLVYRHPFPGPGLGVRVLGEVRREYVETLRRADSIYIEELRAAGLYERVSQAFAVFLPVRSVGVTGDARHYAHVIALRAVETVDFMTAHAAALPHDSWIAWRAASSTRCPASRGSSTTSLGSRRPPSSGSEATRGDRVV